MLRIVVDTNILISSLIKSSNLFRALFHHIEKSRIILVFSWYTLEELLTILARPKICKLTKMKKKDIENFIDLLIKKALFVEPHKKIKLCRDPSDNKFLEAAKTGQAEYIVTGDKDLLVMRKHRGIKIIKLSEFMERILPYAA